MPPDGQFTTTFELSAPVAGTDPQVLVPIYMVALLILANSAVIRVTEVTV